MQSKVLRLKNSIAMKEKELNSIKEKLSDMISVEDFEYMITLSSRAQSIKFQINEINRCISLLLEEE